MQVTDKIIDKSIAASTIWKQILSTIASILQFFIISIILAKVGPVGGLLLLPYMILDKKLGGNKLTINKRLVIRSFFVTIITLALSIFIEAGLPDVKTATPPHELKEVLSKLNYSIELNINENNVNANTCPDCNSNRSALAKFFINKFNVTKSNTTATIPYFYTAYGMRIDIIRTFGKCGANNSTDPDRANCVILVDINGDKLPNSLSTGNKKQGYDFKDQYKFVVKADKVEPAFNSTNDATLKAIQ